MRSAPPKTASTAQEPAELSPNRGRWITDWRPEDEAFWAGTGKSVAQRNLVFSILSEHIGFSVWTVWSVLVLFMGPNYGISPADKFLLTSLPALVGSVLRIPYTFAVARFGGRNWTVFSAALLLVPTVAAAIAMKPGVSLTTLLAVAALAGVGGGNFASSMANINAFYPDRAKGWALGLNAGGGNVGVAVVQLVGLLVLAVWGKEHPRYVLGVYLPLIILASLGAALFMDNLAGVRNDKRGMHDVLRYGDTWFVSLLYIGTFGSFIGFGFAFGQVLQVQFKSDFPTPIDAAYVTFLGPLVGSLIRPVGGRLADRFGGGTITFWNFVAMAAAGGVVLTASLRNSLPLFLAGFVALFVLSGIGNGSTYKMIPAIFRSRADVEIMAGADAAAAWAKARRLSAALIGVAGAIGAFGGVLVNLAFRQSFLETRNGNAAYIAFIAFYVLCFLVTYLVYIRPRRATVDS
ncbi:nitrate/nitrite transporter [Parafrankia discariae]|uniref:nitrate/nitrite transporter n=1 Tax=Parafrankia discariae TaxID=365528 RepID=UPI00036C2B52|nr:nitrate/nitrite transporter [Parafrankia discariae]